MQTFEFTVIESGQGLTLTISALPWKVTAGEEFQNVSFYGEHLPYVNVNYTNRESTVDFRKEGLTLELNPKAPLAIPYSTPLLKQNGLESMVEDAISDDGQRAALVAKYNSALAQVCSRFR